MKKRKSSFPLDGEKAAKTPMCQSGSSIVSIFCSPLTHLLLIMVAGIAIYGNTFGSPFVLDDVTTTYGNPLVRDFAFTFRPRIVGDLTFALNYRLGGMDVAGYHLVNLIIHLVTGGLVYFLVSLLRKTPCFSGAGMRDDHRLIPLFTALLFVCHPVQTQAITYISQRFASLATLFYIGTLVLWLVARHAGTRNRRVAWYALALVTALLAMATKEMAATLPVTILLLEWVFFGGPLRRLLLPVMLFAVAASLIPLAFFAAGKASLLEQLRWMTTPTDVISRWDYLFTQFRVLATYLRLLFLPTGQNFDYDYVVSHALFSLPVAASLLLNVTLLVIALYLIVRARRSGQADLRLIGFGILWFYLTLSVESSLIPLQDVIFEHRLYLPSVGFFAALVTAAMTLRRELENRKIPAGGVIVPALGVAVLLLALAAAARNEVWQDEVTLWQDVVTKSPAKARAHGSLGSAYQKRGLYDAAGREYQAAIALDPRDPANYNNAGTVYHLQKNWPEAAGMYRQALALNGRNPKAHYNLGTVLTELGRLSEAEQELREATRLKPDYDEAHNSLGIVYAKLSRHREALAEFQQAVSLNPGNKEAVSNRQALDRALKGMEVSRR